MKRYPLEKKALAYVVGWKFDGVIGSTLHCSKNLSGKAESTMSIGVDKKALSSPTFRRLVTIPHLPTNSPCRPHPRNHHHSHHLSDRRHQDDPHHYFLHSQLFKAIGQKWSD
jgi:hypothetical protein